MSLQEAITAFHGFLWSKSPNYMAYYETSSVDVQLLPDQESSAWKPWRCAREESMAIAICQPIDLLLPEAESLTCQRYRRVVACTGQKGTSSASLISFTLARQSEYSLLDEQLQVYCHQHRVHFHARPCSAVWVLEAEVGTSTATGSQVAGNSALLARLRWMTLHR